MSQMDYKYRVNFVKVQPTSGTSMLKYLITARFTNITSKEPTLCANGFTARLKQAT